MLLAKLLSGLVYLILRLSRILLAGVEGVLPGVPRPFSDKKGRQRRAYRCQGRKGWVDFDPTNSIIGNRNLIRVAVAWSPEHVLPLWGTYTGLLNSFVAMDVDVRVTEASRHVDT